MQGKTRTRLTVSDSEGGSYEILIISELPRQIWDAKIQLMVESALAYAGYELDSVRQVTELQVELRKPVGEVLLQPAKPPLRAA
jgi:hypothetical protein